MSAMPRCENPGACGIELLIVAALSAAWAWVRRGRGEADEG